MNLNKLNAELATKTPEEIIRWAREHFGIGLVMTSSFGAESAMLLFMATKVVPQIPVILIDTGYLFRATHAFKKRLRNMWNLNLKTYSAVISPAVMEEKFGRLWEKGEAGKAHYHRIRKVRPKQRALRELGAKAVLSGVRADQTENRSKLNTVELNPQGVYEIHPLLKWTRREIGGYFLIHELPYHPLVERGYGSIGDTHSTVRGEGRSGRILGARVECGVVIQK
ncbi:MAG: phosphoadenylyl-sulfate reductase [bacterium]|nr:phosphoadenylyl-sulfate reductase [bacterium]